jgi:hypothetical protein
MWYWEVTEKRRGDTTIPRNAAANLSFSRVLNEASRVHVVLTFCPAGAYTWGNDQFQEYPVGLGQRCFLHRASHNAGRDMASNQLTFASPGHVWTICRLPIAPLAYAKGWMSKPLRYSPVFFRKLNMNG